MPYILCVYVCVHVHVVYVCRSKESLGQWQEEARADHLKSAVEPSLPPPITDTAPYATDSVTPQQHHPAEEVRIYID